jgi:glycoside/pentoside/hexuronide:cation symporter, GPH family
MIRLKEKLAYSVGDVAQNLVQTPLTAFLLFYLTDVVGIAAAVAGSILLFGQLLNGLTDLAIGYLIDKTDSRWGKARPWVIGTAVPMAVLFVMAFSVPAGLGETGKVIWVAACYAGVVAVFFTASNVAYSALLSVVTPDPNARITLASFRFVVALVTVLVASSVTLPLVKTLGNDQHAWTTMASVYAAVMVATMAIVFFGTTERVRPEGERSSLNQPARVLFGTVMRNRYFYVVAGLFVCFFTFNGVVQAAGVYYAGDVLGDPSLFGLLSIASVVPVLVGIPFMPRVFRALGKRRAFLVGAAVMLAGCVVSLLSPENLPLVLSGHVLRGVGTVPFAVGLFAIVADVVDYGEWRFGVRADGITYSAVTIGLKAGAGIGAGLTGWGLSVGGYAAGAARQSATAHQAILGLYFYVPIALVVVVGVLAHLFTIERHAADITAMTLAESSDAATPSAV